VVDVEIAERGKEAKNNFRNGNVITGTADDLMLIDIGTHDEVY